MTEERERDAITEEGENENLAIRPLSIYCKSILPLPLPNHPTNPHLLTCSCALCVSVCESSTLQLVDGEEEEDLGGYMGTTWATFRHRGARPPSVWTFFAPGQGGEEPSEMYGTRRRRRRRSACLLSAAAALLAFCGFKPRHARDCAPGPAAGAGRGAILGEILPIPGSGRDLESQNERKLAIRIA